MKTTSKNPLTNYISFKRYTLLIPVVLVLIATIVFAIWGVNKGNDLKTNYSFTIEFNTTVSKSNYNKYVDILNDTMKSNDTGVSYTLTAKISLRLSSSLSCSFSTFSPIFRKERAACISASMGSELGVKASPLSSMAIR